MIKPINNYVLFTCDKEFEDELRLKAGLVLKVATQADHGRFNRIYGDVIAIPGKLTNDVNLYQRYEGAPEPKASFSGEMIEKLAKAGYKLTGKEYECTPYERQYTTLSDISQDVEVGDRIYFHYNTIDEENKYTLADGRKIYKVRYDQIFCTVRNSYAIDIDQLEKIGKPKELMELWYTDRENPIFDEMKKNAGIHELPPAIIPIGGHVLVSDMIQHGVVEVEIEGKKIRGRLSKYNIVEELSQATEDLEGQTFEGVLEHIGSPLKGEDVLDVKPGEKVLCSSNSNWKNVINGKEYFVMKQRDLIAKIDG